MLRTSPADLLRCRFAVSPLWELVSAVRVTRRRAEQRWHLPWLATLARGELPSGLPVLAAMQPGRGYTPDFWAPTPAAASATVYDELERVARTPRSEMSAELARCAADQTHPQSSVLLTELGACPAQARDRIVQALQECWDVLLAAHWPRLQALLGADVAHHAQRLAEIGLAGLLNELHPDVRFREGAVQVGWQQRVVRQSRELAGDGLVLMPSAFTWPHAVAVLDLPWQPTVVYPARGVGALWEPTPAPAALAGVLGATRALLLADLAVPAATTVLAERFEMAPSTLSRHLKALQAAGLLRAHRPRRHVLYERTPLGSALARAASSVS